MNIFFGNMLVGVVLKCSLSALFRGQRSSAQLQRRLLSGRNSSSSIPRTFTQCANSRLHTLLARAIMRVRRGAALSGIRTQQPNCSAILWRLYDAAVKIPKPGPRSVVPSSHLCHKPSELPDGESVGSLALHISIVYCVLLHLGGGVLRFVLLFYLFCLWSINIA